MTQKTFIPVVAELFSVFTMAQMSAIKMIRPRMPPNSIPISPPRFLGRVKGSAKPAAAAPQQAPPAHPAQRLSQARAALKGGDGCKAQTLLTNFPAGPQAAEAGRLLTLAEFVCTGGRNLGGSGETQAQYLQAAAALGRHESSAALYSLLVAMNQETGPGQTKAKSLMEAIFTLLGETDPLTQQYRPLVK